MMNSRTVLWGVTLVLLGGVFLDRGGVRAQDRDYVLSIPETSGAPGSEVALPVNLDNQGGDIQGWVLGVCQEPAELSLVGVEMGATTLIVNGGGPPDFYCVQVFTIGWTVAVVVDFLGMSWISPGLGYELHIATYEVLGDFGSSPICFCDGDPAYPVTTGVIVGGQLVIPVQECGGVDTAAPSFIRGDCNTDASYDIADAIHGLTILFDPEIGPVVCVDACDVNDDGGFNIADPIYLLGDLFADGPSPPEPTSECGTDPTVDAGGVDLGCEMFDPCP